MATRPAHERVRAWAYIVLLGGLLVAALVFAFAPDDASDAMRQVTDNPGYEYNLERIGGRSMVYAARFTDWFAGLWHGRTLATTIAVLVVACSLAMLGVARRMRRMPPPRPREERSEQAGVER